MNMRSISAAFKLPSSPYPGLRPFLDHEAALLMGRTDQIDDVITRLRDTHFVAVIGGSGSGKSSLVRAGVVPELRGFRIPEAGDYWVPVICTPGTTNQMEGMQHLQTPITRLAWKFAHVLDAADKVKRRVETDKGVPIPGDPEHNRRGEIAMMLGQRGFRGLVEFYSTELPPAGPPPDSARFLFVIDQFEELFHPNNRNNEHARELIEAVIDHFFDPHPRCFVILTMRSEHLADCASFLQLPDAINKSSYLVRRLDENELRDAIIGPALYFQRLIQRGQALTDTPSETDIQFAPEVVARLLDDVARLSNDTDHLPLLQHILARLWSAACGRESVSDASQAPASVTWDDLEHATDPRSQRAPGWLKPGAESSINTLRASLENCAQAVYEDVPENQRKLVDLVLRRLAFKDPNSSTYSQQRLCVDDHTLFSNNKHPRAQLQELLQDRFLNDVNYLFWDEEDPDNVALKVSHESFIRGWPHFRELVDNESNRFDEFVSVLRKCAQWSHNKSPDFFLQYADLVRFKSEQLERVFNDSSELKAWFRILLLHHHAGNLARVEPNVKAFLSASRKHVASEQRTRLNAVRLRRNHRVAIAVAFTLLVLLFVAGSLNSVQNTVVAGQGHFFSANNLVQDSPRPGAWQDEAQTAEALGALLLASDAVDKGNSSVKQLYGIFPDLVATFSTRVNEGRFTAAYASSEPMVNGSLRRLLTSGLWRNTVPATPSLETDPGSDATCHGLNGHLVADPVSGRAIFVPTLRTGDKSLLLFGAQVKEGVCRFRNFMLSFPRELNPQILFDSQPRHMLVVLEGRMTQYVIKWNETDDGDLAPSAIPMSSTDDPGIVAMIRNEVDRKATDPSMSKAASVPSRIELGGYEWLINGHPWRSISDNAQLIDNPGPDANWRTLDKMPAQSQCAIVERNLRQRKIQPGFSLDMYQDGDRCFAIRHGNAGKRQAATGGTQTSTSDNAPPQSYVVNVYHIPKGLSRIEHEDKIPSPIASFVAFDNLSGKANWVVGSGQYDGWIAHRRDIPDGRVYMGTPWSTKALKVLGEEVKLRHQAALGSAKKTAAPAPTVKLDTPRNVR